jgi:hypothetical protein
VPAEVQGVIDTNDCHVGPGLGYADAYRIRVQDTLVVTFQTLAPVGYDPPILDTELDLFRVDDLDDYDASRVLLVHDDDNGDGLAALLSFPLMPLIEYLIVVKGKDDFSVGRYRLLVAP